MDYNHYLSSASITRRVIDESSSTVDWMNKHGAKLELIDWNPQQGQNPYPIRWRIYHRYVDNAGAFKNMYDAFGKLGGKLLLQTRAYDLTQDKDGNVTAASSPLRPRLSFSPPAATAAMLIASPRKWKAAS